LTRRSAARTLHLVVPHRDARLPTPTLPATMIVVLAALALLQQGQAQQQSLPGLKESPVTRIAVSPAALVVAASDSIQLHAVAYDASGKRIDNAGLRFSAAASNAGALDSSG